MTTLGRSFGGTNMKLRLANFLIKTGSNSKGLVIIYSSSFMLGVIICLAVEALVRYLDKI